MRKILSAFLVVLCLFMLIPSREIVAYTEINKNISAKIEAQKKELKDQILFTQSEASYGYGGYKGVKLTPKGQKCADMAALMSLMPDEVSDYFGENISRKDFAILLSRELGVLTGQSRTEMTNAYGLRKLSDTKQIEVQLCASLNLLVENGEKNFRPDEILTKEDAAKALWRFVILTGGTEGPGEEKPSEKLTSLYDPYLKTPVWNAQEKELFSGTYLTKEGALVLTIRSFDAIVAAHMKEASAKITPTPTPTVTPNPTTMPEPTNSSSASITPSPSPATKEHSMIGKRNFRLKGDKKPTDCIWDVLKSGNYDNIDLGGGPVAEPKNPVETTRILKQLKAKETWFLTSYIGNGALKETALYAGSRAQLDKYVKDMLKHNMVKYKKDDITAITSYFLSGNGLGTVMEACCEKPMIVGEVGELEFSNKESAHKKLLYTSIELWIKNMDFKFKLDPTINLENAEKVAKTKSSFMMIDPEKQLLLCYVKGDAGKNVGKFEGCWILKADVDESGKKVYLDGHLITFHSSGIRNVFEAHYLTEIK